MIIGERCNGIERQTLFSIMSEKILFIFYQDIKHKWGRKSVMNPVPQMKEIG
jgi:hypothetical protein